MIFRHIHWRLEFQIHSTSALLQLIFNFQLFHGLWDSFELAAADETKHGAHRRIKKHTTWNSNKKLSKFSLQHGTAGIHEWYVFLKWLMGMKSFFVCAGICAHTHMCSFYWWTCRNLSCFPCVLIKGTSIHVPASVLFPALALPEWLSESPFEKPSFKTCFLWKALQALGQHGSFANIAQRWTKSKHILRARALIDY